MNQRQSKDRRRLEWKKHSFPFKDSNGERVLDERRKQPDRRMNGINEGEGLAMPWRFEN